MGGVQVRDGRRVRSQVREGRCDAAECSMVLLPPLLLLAYDWSLPATRPGDAASWCRPAAVARCGLTTSHPAAAKLPRRHISCPPPPRSTTCARHRCCCMLLHSKHHTCGIAAAAAVGILPAAGCCCCVLTAPCSLLLPAPCNWSEPAMRCALRTSCALGAPVC